MSLADLNAVSRHEDPGIVILNLESAAVGRPGVEGERKIGVLDVDRVEKEVLFEEPDEVDIERDSADGRKEGCLCLVFIEEDVPCNEPLKGVEGEFPD